MRRQARDQGLADVLAAERVPEHGPRFWDDLEAALGGEQAYVPSSLDEARHRAAERDARSRRTRAAALGSVAAAVLVVAAAVVATSEPGDEGRRGQLVAERVAPRRESTTTVTSSTTTVVTSTTAAPEKTPEEPVLPPDEESEDTPTTTVQEPAEPTDTPIATTGDEVVLAFVDAAAAGELDTAWGLLTPGAQERIGRKAFDDLRSGLAEGWGAWSGTEVEPAVLELDDEGDQVVLLVGEVEQEGTVGQRADAIPVRSVEGTPRLDLFPSAAIEVLLPESGADGPLVVSAFAPARSDVRFSVAGAPFVPAGSTTGADGDQVLASLGLDDQSLPEGDHLVVVAARTVGGDLLTQTASLSVPS